MRKKRGRRNLTRSPWGASRGSWEGEAPAAQSVGGRWQWLRCFWRILRASAGISRSLPPRTNWDSASGLGEPAAAAAGAREGSGDWANDGGLFSSSALLFPAPRLRRVCFPSWIPLPFTSVRQTRANLPHSPRPQPDGRGGWGEQSGQLLGCATHGGGGGGGGLDHLGFTRMVPWRLKNTRKQTRKRKPFLATGNLPLFSSPPWTY